MFLEHEMIPNTICFECIEVKAGADGIVVKKGQTKQEKPSPYVRFIGAEYNGARWLFTAFDEVAEKIKRMEEQGKIFSGAKLKIFGTVTTAAREAGDGKYVKETYCKIQSLYFRGCATGGETSQAAGSTRKEQGTAQEKKPENASSPKNSPVTEQPRPKRPVLDESMFVSSIGSGKRFG